MLRRATSAPYVAVVFLLLAGASHAAVWRVNSSARGSTQDGKTWPSAFRTLQAALDAADDGDEVWVAQGLYHGGFKLSRAVGLYGGFSGRETVRSQRDYHRNRTILDGSHRECVLSAGLLDAAIDGFTIRNGVSEAGAGIRIVGNPAMPVQLRISHNIVLGNMATDRRIYKLGGGGIACATSGDAHQVIVSDNIIAANSGIRGGGLYLQGIRAVVRYNTIVANSGPLGGALYLGNCKAQVQNNIVAFNDVAVKSERSTQSAFRNNCFHGNLENSFYGMADPVGANGNISADPLFANRDYGDLHLRANSPCRGRGLAEGIAPGETDIDGEPRVLLGSPDIGADEIGRRVWSSAGPRVVYVSNAGNDRYDGYTWTRAKRTIQAGIDTASTEGGDVFVKPGIYRERIIVPPYVYLHGGQVKATRGRAFGRDAMQAVLDGQGIGAVVTFIAGRYTGGLDGFLIRGGMSTRAERPFPLPYFLWPAGIHCLTASPRITGCVVTGNWTGVALENSSAVVSGNDVSDNSADGIGMSAYTDSPTIQRPLLQRNMIARNAGAGCASWNSSAAIAGNAIMDNGLAGVDIWAFGRGGAALVMTGNTIFGNGKGVTIIYDKAIVVNNIVAHNGGGIYVDEPSTVVFRNNCLFRNTGNTISGLPVGSDGNFEADPRLADMYPDDPHIEPDSPCRNAGDNAYADLTEDIDRQPRIADGSVDIGADESTGAAYLRPEPRTIRVRPNGDDASDGSSWARAKRTLSAALMELYAGGGEVWVAAGVYPENILLPSHTSLLGGFIGTELSAPQRDPHRRPTVIDGRERGAVIVQATVGDDSLVDGFTIQGGAEYRVQRDSNSGLQAAVVYKGSGTISNNVITANKGFAVSCENGDVVVSRNTITENNRGGVDASHCTVTIEGNTVRDNWLPGSGPGVGGLACIQSSGTVRDNVVTGHLMDRTLEHTWGSGIGISESSVSVVNNSVVGNTIGLILNPGNATPVFANNVIAYNSIGLYQWPYPGLEPVVRHNCVYGNTEANFKGLADRTGIDGNISVDPLIAALPSSDIHLQPDSPCINAGDSSYTVPGETDIDGQPRILGLGVDIGADESR